MLAASCTTWPHLYGPALSTAALSGWPYCAPPFLVWYKPPVWALLLVQSEFRVAPGHVYWWHHDRQRLTYSLGHFRMRHARLGLVICRASGAAYDDLDPDKLCTETTGQPSSVLINLRGDIELGGYPLPQISGQVKVSG